MNASMGFLIDRNNQSVFVPLKSVNFSVDLTNILASVTMTQVYKNSGNRAIEAVFCFPVDEKKALSGFEVFTKDGVIKGEIEEREKAFLKYDEALEQGNRAFLLDQETDDILYLSVGNLMPQEEVLIKISYVFLPDVYDGVMRISLPLSLSPRYAGSNFDPVKLDRITPPYSDKEVPYDYSINVEISGLNIKEISSPSHEITHHNHKEKTVVTLKSETTKPDRDFVLEVRLAEKNEPQAFVGKHENGDLGLLFTFYPDFKEIFCKKSFEQRHEIVFVIDCSGSMSGSSIYEAKRAVRLALKSMNTGDMFNIFLFGSTFKSFKPRSVEYDENTLKEALGFVESIDANLGGTEIYPVLHRVLNLKPEQGCKKTVILLTDGEVFEPEEVIRLVAQFKDRVRIFTFGIGYGVSHYLVSGIARASGGVCEMIYPGERIEEKVLRQFSRIFQPEITDLKFSFKGFKASMLQRVSSIFEGDIFTALGFVTRYSPSEADKKVILECKVCGEKFKFEAPVKFLGQQSAILTLWAQKKVQALKEGGSEGSMQWERKKKLIAEKIKELGLKYNLLTDYTSFVAVYEPKDGSKNRGNIEFKRVPVVLTKDWHGTDTYSAPVAFVMMSSVSFPHVLADQFVRGAPRRKSKKSRFDKLKETVFPYLLEEAVGGDDDTSSLTLEEIFKLLDTQEAQGYFSDAKIVSKILNSSVKTVKKAARNVKFLKSDDAIKVIVTVLAIHILSKVEVKSITVQATKKAKMYLKNTLPDFNKNIVDLLDIIKNYLKIEISLKNFN